MSKSVRGRVPRQLAQMNVIDRCNPEWTEKLLADSDQRQEQKKTNANVLPRRPVRTQLGSLIGDAACSGLALTGAISEINFEGRPTAITTSTRAC
jgi:hypothetical protein